MTIFVASFTDSSKGRRVFGLPHRSGSLSSVIAQVRIIKSPLFLSRQLVTKNIKHREERRKKEGREIPMVNP
jgi:hypothetical protein